jgi:hypothetical protein
MDYDSKYFKGKFLALKRGGTTLQWIKNIVKNIVFQSCVCLNFHQANTLKYFL